MVAAAVQHMTSAARGDATRQIAPPLLSVCSSIESCLTPRFEQSWGHTMGVFAVAVERLGPASSVLLSAGLRTLGDIGDLPGLHCRAALDETLGAAMRVAGLTGVLAAIPLDLDRAVAEASQVREGGREAGEQRRGRGSLTCVCVQMRGVSDFTPLASLFRARTPSPKRRA